MAKSSKKRQVPAAPGTKWSQVVEITVKELAATSKELAQGGGPTPARSRIMRSIRQKNTKPEVLVRKLLHAMGFRFRLHQRDLPGRPDIVLRRHNAVVQVHGCFWHQHNCAISNVPRTRQGYWLPKLARNVARDRENEALIKSLGWKTMTVWECELRDPMKVARSLKAFILKGH